MRIVNIMVSKVLGGVEQAFLDYNKAMASKGHEVFAIFNKNGKIDEKIEKINHVHYIPLLFIKPYFIFFLGYLVRIKRISPQIIIVHSKRVLPLFSLIGKILKVPVVVVCHNEKTKIIDKADYIFSVTQYQKNIFIKAGFNEKKIFVIPNLIPFKVDYKEFTKYSDPPIFGIIGRFDPTKGFPLFIGACKILKDKDIDFKVKIAGIPQKQYMHEYNRITDLIKTYNLTEQIEFLGWISEKDEFYNHIDIFVMPSINESFGIVLLEAMMYSKPIISSLTSGPKEILENKDVALTFSVNDEVGLSNQMIKLINDESLAKKMVKNGYDLVNNEYTLDKVANKLNIAIGEVINDSYTKN